MFSLYWKVYVSIIVVLDVSIIGVCFDNWCMFR